MYRVNYKKKALKCLRKMPRNKANDFLKAFKRIAVRDTEGFDITKFRQIDNALRLRIGDYRAVYTVENKELVIEVIKIGSRGDIYK